VRVGHRQASNPNPRQISDEGFFVFAGLNLMRFFVAAKLLAILVDFAAPLCLDALF
jgi:hypothetical protein